MQVRAHMDVEVVAVEQDERVAVMLELVAPVADEGAGRPPATVQVVLDRSGSMDGERLAAARHALARLVDRLHPSDRLGVVAFDDEVQVVLPAGEVRDRHAARRAVSAIAPGGCTNLSSGLLRGLQEAARVAGEAGATVLVLSDGHANAGETDPDRLASVAAGARARGITTSTVGIGLGYDEGLLSALARGGQGDHVFAEHADAAVAAVAGEVDGLLATTIQAASLIVRPAAPVEGVAVHNDVPAQPVPGGIMLELGDLWSGEERKVVLTFDVPAKTALGLAEVAVLELRFVALPGFREQTVTVPVHVNVVPGDQAAGRIPDPKVRDELVYQEVQAAKRRASEALRRGDAGAAADAYAAAAAQVDGLAAPAPELAEEALILRDLRDRARDGGGAWAAKYGLMDAARKSRKRGRRV